MISLSMEMPDCLLAELNPLIDQDFALAHRVLEDDEYAEHFYSSDKEVILDNGFHELGYPLDSHELLRAADLIEPDWVVCPDWLGETQKTYQAAMATAKLFKSKYPLAVVLVGDNPAARNTFMQNTRGLAQMLCLPYRAPRLEWFNQATAIPFERIHLLGLNEPNELSSFQLAESFPMHLWSVDTSKPVKWGLMGKQIWDLASLRKCPLKTPELLTYKAENINPLQKMWIAQNIAYLRRFLG